MFQMRGFEPYVQVGLIPFFRSQHWLILLPGIVLLRLALLSAIRLSWTIPRITKPQATNTDTKHVTDATRRGMYVLYFPISWNEEIDMEYPDRKGLSTSRGWCCNITMFKRFPDHGDGFGSYEIMWLFVQNMNCSDFENHLRRGTENYPKIQI